jgi:sialidase-1
MKSTFAFLMVLVVGLVVLWGCDGKNGTREFPGKDIVLRLEPSNNNPRNSEGDFITLKNGRILFIYTHFTGGSADDAAACLASRFSDDRGVTWSHEDQLVLANEAVFNIMSVSLLRLPNGDIGLFYLRKNAEGDCLPLLRISTDEAQTWGPARVCIDEPGYYVMNNDRVVQLSGGRILLPVALHQTNDGNLIATAQILCYCSDDNGKTFFKGGIAANPEQVVTQEPGVVELKDGRVMLFCRTESGVQYISFSNDRGATWTPLQPSTIRSPLSPASIERIPATGDLLLVWNNNYKPVLDGGKRTPFTLAISRDEGKSWERIKNIESDPAGWYCYTAIEFVGNDVLLGHCAGNTRITSGLAATQITRLSREWIYSTTTPDPSVKIDSAGTVALNCPDPEAQIRYTLDDSLPTARTALIYKSPFHVSRTTPLLMQAFAPGKPASLIVGAYVGSDVLQPALEFSGEPGPGVIYHYFEGEAYHTDDIAKIPFVETGVIANFSLSPRRREINFAFIFAGFIDIRNDGPYTFYLESNDGSVLIVDDHTLINNDGTHGVYEKSATMALRNGPHKIECRYFQLGGRKELKISWQGPGFKKTELGGEFLGHTRAGK